MLTDDEFDSILNREKRIQGVVRWREDEDHSPAREFRVDVESRNGPPMFVHGRYNVDAGKLSYALILRATGRIYAFDMGKKHRNPGGTEVGEKHKHQWSERYRDKKVYVPDDITAGISDPVSRLEAVLCRSTYSSRWLHGTANYPRGARAMNVSRLCEDLQTGIGPLFTCSEQGEYLRVRTPYLYPDGDYIDLFCNVEGDVLTVSDLAETTGWLRMQSATLRRSSRQNLLIEDVCVTHGIEFHRGMLQARCRSGEELAQVVTRVAQAALRVSDLWFTLRTRTVQSTADEVADFLTERKFQFYRARKLAGRSGRDWKVDFDVRNEKHESLVQVLSTGNRTVAQGISARALAAWHDLSHYAADREAMTFVSLFDDTFDVWGDDDFRLVETFSKVTFWSRPDEFAEILRETA